MSTTTQLQEEHVPLASRIWVSAADGASATMGGLVFNGALTYYFLTWRGMDPSLSALAWIIFGIWNAVNDPLFGYISDRTKHKLGRRIPYIRFGAPLYALAFIGLWLIVPGTKENQTWMFVQLLLFLFLFDALYTAIATSIYIMPFEMALSTKARGSILIWKLLFNVFSTAVPLLLVNPLKPKPGEDSTGFILIFSLIGVAMAAVIFISTFFYQEKHFTQEEEQAGFIKSLVECFKNRSFLIFEIISFTVVFVQTCLMLGIFYYFDELKVPAVPLYVAMGVGILVGVIVWVRQRDRWGIKRCVQLFCGFFAIGCLIMLVFGRSLEFSILGFFLVGTGFAGGMYLIPLINGEVIDFDEVKTNLRREGMYAGVNSFVTKPAISLANAAFGWIITLFGYQQGSALGTQSSQAQTGILVGWMLIPTLLLAISFVGMHWYPLSGKYWGDIKQKLARDHEEKEKRFLAEKGYRAD